MKYTHLSLEEREKLYAWKESGKSIREIAKKLGRSHSSLLRELSRHTKYGKEYIPCLAQKRSEIWSERQRYQAPLKSPLIFLYVREKLREKWSPETIAGRLPIDHPGYSIGVETIYRYIYGKKQVRQKQWKYLTHHRKRRLRLNGRKVKGQGRILEAIPIEQRPKEAQLRTIPGHWESDNMEGKKSDTTGVSVTVDRTTRITRIRKLKDHTATTKSHILIDQLNDENWKQTLTLDRGVENKKHTMVAIHSGIPVFFCNAYHSWEKGTVENTIGRIRRYIPKGTSVDGISEEYLLALEDLFNNTPRKVLGFLTPNEILLKIQSSSFP